MIFAHGPLGYVLALATQKIWGREEYTEKQKRWFLVLGCIAGIFPDVDLFFYYLVDAQSSHRALPTHVPLTYIILCGVVYAVARLRNMHWLQSASSIFLIGTMSHLLTDGMFAQVRYLAPFSTEFFGLADVVSEFARNNLLAVNFIVEGTIIAAFFYTLIRQYAERLTVRIPLVALLLGTYCLGVVVVYVGNAHVAHVSMPMYYDDLDHDSVVNIQDRDMDGDGTLNIDDVDSDNDGESNPMEIAQQATQLIGVWYDPTNGGLIQIPARLGFLTTVDTLRVLLDSAGVSLRAEMSADYAVNPDGYATTDLDNQFDRTLANIHTWLKHQGRLEMYADGRDQIGDILFFKNGFVAMVVGFDNKGQATVLDVSPKRVTRERFLDAVVRDEGEILERGKMLNAQAINRE